MKRVFEVEVIKDVTADDCATWLEAHRSWQVKTGRRLYATKRSDEYTTVHYISGEAKGPVAEQIFIFVNQPLDCN